jgi:hypothetical protein
VFEVRLVIAPFFVPEIGKDIFAFRGKKKLLFCTHNVAKKQFIKQKASIEPGCFA